MRMDLLLMLRMLAMVFVVLALMALLEMAMPVDLAASNVIYQTLLSSFFFSSFSQISNIHPIL